MRSVFVKILLVFVAQAHGIDLGSMDILVDNLVDRATNVWSDLHYGHSNDRHLDGTALHKPAGADRAVQSGTSGGLSAVKKRPCAKYQNVIQKLKCYMGLNRGVRTWYTRRTEGYFPPAPRPELSPDHSHPLLTPDHSLQLLTPEYSPRVSASTLNGQTQSRPVNRFLNFDQVLQQSGPSMVDEEGDLAYPTPRTSGSHLASVADTPSKRFQSPPDINEHKPPILSNYDLDISADEVSAEEEDLLPRLSEGLRKSMPRKNFETYQDPTPLFNAFAFQDQAAEGDTANIWSRG